MPELQKRAQPLLKALPTAFSQSSRKRKAKQDAAQYLAKRRKLEGVRPSEYISKLPVEVWQHIASYLPLHALILLSRSCQPLRQALGNKALIAVREPECPMNPPAFQERRMEQAKSQSTTTLGRLPTDIWLRIISHLTVGDEAALLTTSQFLYSRLAIAYPGDHCPAFCEIERPMHWRAKLKFLFHASQFFKDREICEECVVYHRTNSWNHHPQRTIGVDLLGPKVSSSSLPGGPGELLWDSVKFHAKQMRQSSERDPCAIISNWVGNEFKMDTNVCFGIHEDRCLIGCVSTQYLTATVMQAKGLDDCFPSLCGHWHVASLLTKDKAELIKHMPQPWDDFDQQVICGGKLWRCASCPTEYFSFVSPVPHARTRGREEAKYALTTIRAMDLGEGYTSHDRFWTALVRGGNEDDEGESVPFDLGPYDSIMRRFLKTAPALYASVAAEALMRTGIQVEPALRDDIDFTPGRVFLPQGQEVFQDD